MDPLYMENENLEMEKQDVPWKLIPRIINADSLAYPNKKNQ